MQKAEHAGQELGFQIKPTRATVDFEKAGNLGNSSWEDANWAGGKKGIKSKSFKTSGAKGSKDKHYIVNTNFEVKESSFENF